MNPLRTGGGFSAHFDKVIGLDSAIKQDWYMLDIPRHSKHDLGRSLHKVAVKPPHESMAEEVAQNPAMLDELAATVDATDWAPNFLAHPKVQADGPRNYLPLGIYVDGVQYQKRGSTLGFWCVNLLTQRRHLMACLPKRDLCRCGCKGYCSIYVVLSMVEWSFFWMLQGLHPSSKHDGPWSPEESRSLMAGRSLGFRAVCVLLKGDWAEFASTLCFKSWSHHQHPCFRCKAIGGPNGTLAQTAGINAIDEPWPTKGMSDIDAACRRCEHTVRVCSKADLSLIVSSLSFDKRRQGASGRALHRDLVAFGLRKGDRLEPFAGNPDTSALDGRADFPFEVRFWRVSEETLVKHRCPLYSERSGIGPELICIDEMHTLHLGIFQDFILTVIWNIFDADVWRLKGTLSDDAYLAHAALVLRGRLFQWYRDEKRRFPEKPLYELPDLTLANLGTRDRPALSSKAAESGTLVAFAFHLASVHRESLSRGPALVQAGRGLMDYLRITRSEPLRMRAACRQALSDAIGRFVFNREAAGIPFKPKAHLAVHMIADSHRFGNPYCTGTWLDEGLNRQLAAVCATAHPAVWSQRVLASFGHQVGPSARAAAHASKKAKVRS